MESLVDYREIMSELDAWIQQLKLTEFALDAILEDAADVFIAVEQAVRFVPGHEQRLAAFEQWQR